MLAGNVLYEEITLKLRIFWFCKKKIQEGVIINKIWQNF